MQTFHKSNDCDEKYSKCRPFHKSNIYNQPNRAISGSASMRAFDKDGNISDIGSIDFSQNSVIEQHYELGYTYKYRQNSISFSSVLRRNYDNYV